MPPKQTIDEKTSLPFKILAPMISIIIMATWTLYGKLSQIERGIEQSWKFDHQQRFVDRLRSGNPTLKVPTVEDIRNPYGRRDSGESLGVIIRP